MGSKVKKKKDKTHESTPRSGERDKSQESALKECFELVPSKVTEICLYSTLSIGSKNSNKFYNQLVYYSDIKLKKEGN